MIKASKIRELNIEPYEEGRPAYVYSASGLTRIGDEFYIVADDELALAVFPSQAGSMGRWLQVFPEKLPLDYKQRKKMKPDLESLSRLPANKHAEYGALLMVPSLSRPNRISGAFMPILDGRPSNAVPVDFSLLREELSKRINELNIEGVAFYKDFVRLFHRGSQGVCASATIDLALAPFIAGIFDTHKIESCKIENYKEQNLGKLDGLELAFTDAVALSDGRTFFLATAEASKNAYDDGASSGSAVGMMKENGEIVSIEKFEGREKLEGLSVDTKADGTLHLFMVCDSDDQTKASFLFEANWKI